MEFKVDKAELDIIRTKGFWKILEGGMYIGTSEEFVSFQ